ncbi:hypothetical protein BC826DRAFT_112279 [Russula brevipes]|nr:hypothetical protein BC826DRAFT_112279 [Russula brevipes]
MALLPLSNTITRASHDICAHPMVRVPHIAARDSRRALVVRNVHCLETFPQSRCQCPPRGQINSSSKTTMRHVPCCSKLTLVPTQTARRLPTPTATAAIPGRDKVLVPARSADRRGTQCHALCARCCVLQAVSTKTLPSVFCSYSSSSARGLSARPRSRTQDAPPYMTSILPHHAERTRKYLYCIPLAAPRFRHPDARA